MKARKPPSAPPPTIPGMVYRSRAMQQVAVQVQRASQSRLPVLITGETGTGKELIARAIHYLSPRAAHPFSPINSTALQPSLVEASLFGHKQGAFTGAHTNALGTLRAANHGTVLLDEIGDLAPELQPKLLRFLQEGEVHVVGETQPRQVDVRIIAATNKDLQALMAAGQFREDLYYRLLGMTIHLPPLRAHKDDLALLVAHFLRQACQAEGKGIVTISEAAMETLLRDEWPGNVRQLQTEVQQALLAVGSGTQLAVEHLSDRLQLRSMDFDETLDRLFRRSRSQPAAKPALTIEFPRELPLQETYQQMQRQFLIEALQRHGWNLTHTAKDLGVSLPKLRQDLKKYGVR
ncbi:MAG: sigma-54-dependent Fis family transcriptional regulator [Blastocatellia bacterium]|nr:sigma-54-dependent Fis family transcriptional regulator [Blastocatellia bacterium]